MHDRTADSTTRWHLASLSLPMLLSSLGTSVANVALPTLARAFDAPFHAIQWVVLSYLLGVTTMIVSVGELGDIVGRRTLLLSGITLFTLASLVCGSAMSLPVLIVGRALQGLGGAVMMALALALVSQAVPKSMSGRAMGLLGSMSAVGTALGPSLGGVTIATLGWRAIFLLSAPLGVIALVLAFRFAPTDGSAARARAPFDIGASVVLALTLAVYALSLTSAHGAWIPAGLAASAAGAVFYSRRRRQPQQGTPGFQHESASMRFVRSESLVPNLVASALVSTVMMATLVVGPFYLSRALGLSTAAVGLTMSVGPLVTAISGLPAGRMVDRFGAARMTQCGLGALASGTFLVATLPTDLHVIGYVIPLIVTTAAYSTFQTANNARVMSSARESERGAIAGQLGLARNLGLITGASAMGAVFALGTHSKDATTAAPLAIVAGMRLTFLVATALTITGSVVLYRAGRRLGAGRFVAGVDGA